MYLYHPSPCSLLILVLFTLESEVVVLVFFLISLASQYPQYTCDGISHSHYICDLLFNYGSATHYVAYLTS